MRRVVDPVLMVSAQFAEIECRFRLRKIQPVAGIMSDSSS
jgi:hypothetical protein